MTKDDYHVLAYRLLAYLYACLKAGEQPQMDYLTYGTDAFPISQSYWYYVLRNLYAEGYITGIALVPIMGQMEEGVKIQPNICITPKGIEYLQNNSAMSKARDFLKTIKEIVPGL